MARTGGPRSRRASQPRRALRISASSMRTGSYLQRKGSPALRRSSGRRSPMERASRPATLGDVAQHAGVSPSTVSNVVWGAAVVAAPTRRRVLNAIEQLGYRPNALARHLLQGRSTTVGIIARDLRNPFFAEMASLVEREVAGFGFATMFCATDGDAD